MTKPESNTTQEFFCLLREVLDFPVLHPGGIQSIRQLAEAGRVGPQSRILNLACGRGANAVFLAKTFGCAVTGIDASAPLIHQASKFARRARLARQVQFSTGDAAHLQLADNTFDAVFSQSMLVACSDKSGCVQEARRVVKSGGLLGWVEPTWRREPDPEFLKNVALLFGDTRIQHLNTVHGWENLFARAGIIPVLTLDFPLQFSIRVTDILAAIGYGRALQFFGHWLFQPAAQRYLEVLRQLLSSRGEAFGYGIFLGKK